MDQQTKNLIEAQQRELRVKDATICQMANDMAAAQAHIKVLRDALENVEGALDESGMYQDYPVTYDLVLEVLSTPHDDSALREMLKAERERCITALHRNADKPIDEIVSVIRAMEDQ